MALIPGLAHSFSISSVTLSPGDQIFPGTSLKMLVGILTPSQPASLYAPTRVTFDNAGLHIDIYPDAGPLTATGSLREEIALGSFSPGTYNYQVVIHPAFDVSWGVRTNRGQFKVVDELPIVTVWAEAWKTAEPCPVCRVTPAVLRIDRSGPLSLPLTVLLSVDGTATAGDDYDSLPAKVEIPAGQQSVKLQVVPKDDLVAEGPEVVRVRLGRSPGYQARPSHEAALISIFDDEPNAPVTRLDIVGPPSTSRHRAGLDLQLEALAVSTRTEVFGPVEFYADGRLVAVAPVLPVGRPPIAGLPRAHAATWKAVPAGTHSLTAVAHLSLSQSITSPPVRVLVERDLVPSVVGIEALSPISEESSVPFRRLPLVGSFLISRSGPTVDPLPVFLHASGTAKSSVDYRRLPFLVTIPAGTNAAAVEVLPVPDALVEGLETVVVEASPCPPPPLLLPCGDFAVDPRRARATVFIRDDGLTEASVVIASPAGGSSFQAGETVPIRALAIDLEGYISRVTFFDGDQQIGVSEITFVQAPPPGTPIEHQFEWRNAPSGVHVLTARAARPDGERVVSPPVRVTVGTGPNESPSVGIIATDAFAVEPAVDRRANFASFQVRRSGPTNAPLTVAYSVQGSAQNGIDYAKLTGEVLIPEGKRTAEILVTPLADALSERLETVVLGLVERPGYRLGWGARAAAVISDPLPPTADFQTRCARLPEGAAHLRFVAPVGEWFRVEASSDLTSWETVLVTQAVDGAVDFVEDPASQWSGRFYRLLREPAGGPQD
jgi:hypothetical protein